MEREQLGRAGRGKSAWHDGASRSVTYSRRLVAGILQPLLAHRVCVCVCVHLPVEIHQQVRCVLLKQEREVSHITCFIFHSRAMCLLAATPSSCHLQHWARWTGWEIKSCPLILHNKLWCMQEKLQVGGSRFLLHRTTWEPTGVSALASTWISSSAEWV